uniref:Transcription elongation factor GreB n=3 Tax=environmental samples TaxID=48479 RepID=C7FPD3_9BACT|nr:transcription elongation factor [uncultured bacterium HF186_25m_30B18]ACU26436.1 transcription elongation factor [uncultured bacterium HF186_75m_14K15]ACU26485.1 transcription elongation factor [uncultured bacterium HF186_25m_13D19]
MATPKNYITPRGFNRLRAEHDQLWFVERPHIVDEVARAAAMGDRSENAEYIYGKKRLREIDRRLRWLNKRLDMTEIVDPAIDRGERIFFGATVTLGYMDGTEKQVALVGVDEIEVDKQRISWRSPLGRLLIGKSEGDEVTLNHAGEVTPIEILEVAYLPQEAE